MLIKKHYYVVVIFLTSRFLSASDGEPKRSVYENVGHYENVERLRKKQDAPGIMYTQEEKDFLRHDIEIYTIQYEEQKRSINFSKSYIEMLAQHMSKNDSSALGWLGICVQIIKKHIAPQEKECEALGAFLRVAKDLNVTLLWSETISQKQLADFEVAQSHWHEVRAQLDASISKP